MADTDISLLFKLRMDAQQTKTATAEAAAAVRQLKGVFGTELNQINSISQSAFNSINDKVADFARQRVPIAGNALANFSQKLQQLGRGESGKELEKVGKSIGEIAKQSGKSTGEIAGFLTRFVQLEGQAKRDKAAIDFFGASLGSELIPKLESTGEALLSTAGSAGAMGGELAAIAGPIGIAVVALLALAAATVVVVKEIFELTKKAAEFQGALFDLSQQTGISVETLSALEVVAATTGGSLGSMTASLGIFQRKLDEAQDPLSKTAAKFRELGVETDDTEKALRQTLKAVSDMKPGFEQTALALELFGRGGKQLLAVLKETGGDLDGTIAKLRELGVLVTTEDAKAADEFNDQLALLGFQFRQITAVITKETLPQILTALTEFSTFLKANRDVVKLFGDAVKAAALTITGPLRSAMLAAQVFISGQRAAWHGLRTVLNSIIDAYEAIRKKIEAIIRLPPIPRVEEQPVTPAGVQPPEQPGSVDTQKKELREIIAAQDELTAVHRKDVEERKRIAASELAQAEANFTRGQSTRREEVEAQKKANREKIQADLDLLAFERSKLLNQIALEASDPQKRKELNARISELDQDAFNKRAELKNFEIRLDAQLESEQRQNLLAHKQRQLDIEARGDKARIDLIRDRVAQGVQAELAGEREIQNIETAGLDRRSAFLVKSLELAGKEPAKRREVLDQLQLLKQERIALEQDQERRIREINQRSTETQLQIIVSRGETVLRILEIQNARRLASIRALADAQVISEEEAARRSVEAQENALIAQEALLRIRLRAAAAIKDPNERAKTEADLNNQLRVLTAEREQIQDDGERQVEAGRQKDLDNLRQYNEDLRELRERTIDIEFDAAQELIDLMVAHHARRVDIIRAQRDLELRREEERHRQATETIDRQRRETEQQIKFLEKHLQGLKKNTKEEIEERDRLIKKIEELRLKLLELKQQQDAENDRSKTRKRRVTKESKDAEDEADPLGRLKIGKEDIKEIARTIEDTIVPLGEILTSTFLRVADAIGQTVSNWVLLGETGPAVMRKILAQALASLAAEAAVNAVKELALGFATLFFNPAESAAHFTAAGLWASVGGVAAIAGRKVAGDLFKPKQASTASSTGGPTTGASGELNPLNLGRNRGEASPARVVVEIRVNDSLFGRAITGHVLKDVRSGGPLRDALQTDSTVVGG